MASPVTIHPRDSREGLLLATAAGVLFGVSDVAIKFLTHANGPLLGLLSRWTLTAVISFVISFYASARSLQIGLAVEVIAITSLAANLAAIVGGVLVFGEPIGCDAVGITRPTARVLPRDRRRGARTRSAPHTLRPRVAIVGIRSRPGACCYCR
jgi:hypothetical protein